MRISTHSIARAGLSVLTASVLVFAQSVQPAPPPSPTPAPAPTVRLAAVVQPTALPPLPSLLTVLLNSPLALLGPAKPLGTGLPPAPTPQAIPIAPNLADTIDSIYVEVEKWVQYGFEVATAVVRWIPYVGWFSGLIMDGYFFGESLVASGVFNFTDWLRGNGGVVENLVDFGIDVGLAFVWLGLDALNSFIPLPPFCCYPQHPPVQGAGPNLASTTLVDPTETAEKTMLSSEPEGLDQVDGLSEDLTEEDVVTDEDLTEEDVVTKEDVTEQEVTTEEDVTTQEDVTTDEDVTTQEDVTTDEDVTEEATPEVTHTEVTSTDTTTTHSLGNVEAQGEIRGPDVDASIDKGAEGNAENGANGAKDANGANGIDAEVETAEDTHDPTETTGATTADSDTGDGDNDSGTK